MFENIVFFTTLALSITLGSYYKTITKLNVKKHYGTGLGILIALMICGRFLYHTIFMVWLNVIILKNCDRRYVHLVSLVYTWLHLICIHISLTNAHYVILLHQNIALRLVGLAFEMYTAANRNNAHNPKPSSSSKSDKKDGGNDSTEYVLESSTIDMLSYAFFFIGLQQGPYFKYKVYYDHLKAPFSSLGNFRDITENKLKKVCLFMAAYLMLRMRFSTEIYTDKKFYEWDAETRYLHNIPFLLMFVLRSMIITLLCTCVCTEAGFGVYPTNTKAIPGQGPTMRPSLLNLSQEQVLMQEYNFSMLNCFDNEKLIVGPRMIDTVRSWDMPTRYWFLVNIHRSIFKASKEIRSACSFLAWALWNGASLQSCIISSTLWVYIHIELVYSRIYNTSGQMQMAWDIGFSIMRMLCLVYLTPCFVICDASTIIRYYNSIFWVFHWIICVLIVGAAVTRRSRSRDE